MNRLLFFLLAGPAFVWADVTYTLHGADGWPANIRSQLEPSVIEAVRLYNQHGSFNKHLNVYYNPWVPTAQAGFDGTMEFGTQFGTRVVLHEMSHTMGCGTTGEWTSLMVNGTWTGAYATTKLREFDGPTAWLHGDNLHFWPYGLNYDSEDSTLNRVRNIKLVAALMCDMNFLSYISEPISKTVPPASTVTLNVNATRAKAYTWYKQGSPNPLANSDAISGANTNTLTISNVNIDHEGCYFCVASADGFAPLSSRPARLAVSRLVSHLKFGGNAYDSMGPNHGTAAGTPLYTAGKIGQAIDLNGTTDSIVLPAGAADMEDFTVAVWVNWDGGNQWQRIFDFGNNTSQFMFLTPRSGSNTMRFVLKNGGSEQTVETAQLTAGQWVHVAVTLSGETATLYVNGAAAAQAAGITIKPGDFSPQINYLGKSQYSADPLFSGRLDEFRLYNYALTAFEIQTLYAGLPELPNPGNNKSNVPTQSYLTWVGGSSGENAWQVYLGTTQSGILSATPSSPEYYGVRHQMQFATPMLSANSTHYWRVDPILPDGTVLKGRIWMFTTGPAVNWHGPQFADSLISVPNAIEGMWYSQSLAEDAVLTETSIFQKIAGPDWIKVSDSGEIIGVPPEGSAGQNFCTVRIIDAQGQIDETVISVWVQDVFSGSNGITDLTAFANHWLYSSPEFCPTDLNHDGTVNLADWSLFAAGWRLRTNLEPEVAWSMDEALGEMLGDFRGRYPALLRNTNIHWRPLESVGGKTGHCTVFDGIDDYAEVVGFKGIAGSAARTCTAWIKTNASGSAQCILSWGSPLEGTRWMFCVLPSGQLAVDIAGGSVQGNSLVNDGRWHHVAAALTNSDSAGIDEINLYVDGVLQTNTRNGSACVINTDASAHVYLGTVYSNGSFSSYFNGRMDEVRIYDTALDDAQIAQLAQNGLIAYWPLNDSGMIAAEAINGCDGMLMNMKIPLRTGGPQIDALRFNGIDQYIAVPGCMGVSGKNSRTCMAWVKTAGSNDDQVILSWGSSAPGQRWIFRVLATGELSVAVGGGYTRGNLSIADDQWHHVAAVLENDGTPVLTEIRFYVDGVLVPATAINAYPINTGIEPVYIGKVNSISLPNYYNGLLDDIRIYNRALADWEIAALAQ